MVLNDSGKKLCAIIPVSKMAGRLHNLKSTISNGLPLGIQFIIVHDHQDLVTGVEIKTIISSIDSEDIKFVEGKFGSPGSARNAGLKLANRDWVTFWDSDDLPEISAFLVMVENANSRELDVAVGSFEIISDLDNAIIGSQILSSDLTRAKMQIASKPGIWRFAFRTKSISGIEFPDLRMAEDQVFLAKVGIGKVKFFITEEIVYKYFMGGPNHLTSQQGVMGDLLEAANLTKLIRTGKGDDNDLFSLELEIRQLVSAIMHGKFRIKLRGIFRLLSLFKFRSTSEIGALVFILRKVVVAE